MALLPNVLPRILDASGNPVPGGTATVYLTGTSTLATVYANASLATPLTNPVVADAGGLLANMYLGTGTYRLVLKDASGNTLKDIDPVNAPSGVSEQASVAEAEAASIAASADYIRTSGYASAGDGGGALYKRVGSEPTHPGKFQSADGAWWEIAEASISALMVGAVWEANEVNTTAIQDAIDAAAGTGRNRVTLPAGSTQCGQITVPDSVEVLGAGIGVTVLTLPNATNLTMIVNDGLGDANIRLHGFTVDGNYVNQTSVVHGIALNGAFNPYVELECRNNRGAGQVYTNGAGLTTGPRNYCHANGKAAAGYGLYAFICDDVDIQGTYDDNCIGVAVEASGSGQTAKRARVSVRARNNRSDFGQSGAGVHFEQSSGGDAGDGICVSCVCTGSTGVGINNTATNLVISGGLIADNGDTGISTSDATGFLYSGIKLLDNGATDAPGYQAQARWDDGGASTAKSFGTMVACYARGSTVDGFKTFAEDGSIQFINNDVSGFTNDYNLGSTLDVVARTLRGTFTATLTGVSGTVTGTVSYSLNGDTVTLAIPAISGTSNTTAATLTGMPAAIRPATAQGDGVSVTDNSAGLLGWAEIATDGTITLRTASAGAFTASGTKGIAASSVTYRITA